MTQLCQTSAGVSSRRRRGLDGGEPRLVTGLRDGHHPGRHLPDPFPGQDTSAQVIAGKGCCQANHPSSSSFQPTSRASPRSSERAPPLPDPSCTHHNTTSTSQSQRCWLGSSPGYQSVRPGTLDREGASVPRLAASGFPVTIRSFTVLTETSTLHPVWLRCI
jgi:hypothetical protein